MHQNRLHLRRQLTDKGRKLFNYDNPSACAGCALKARCTKAGYRTVSRWEHEASLERMAAVVKCGRARVEGILIVKRRRPDDGIRSSLF